MTRLTKRNEDGTIDVQLDGCMTTVYKGHIWYEPFAKLASYEDMEESCKLIDLPCKVGDIVYRVVLRSDSYDGTFYPTISTRYFTIDMIDKIGVIYFLTREKAEEKLKEIRNNG